MIVINVLLIVSNFYVNNKIEYTNEIITQKNQQIEYNKQQINQLESSIQQAKANSELVEKEYNVWVHQNEKLQDILN